MYRRCLYLPKLLIFLKLYIRVGLVIIMDSTFINVDLENEKDIIDLEVLSDEHTGDPKQDKELWERREEAILDDPNRYTAFGGDQFNNIMPWDKRYNIDEGVPMPSLTTEVKEWSEHHKRLFELNKSLIDAGKAPKIWYGLAGNHEYMDRTIDDAWMRELFESRNISYLGSKGWVGLQVSYKGKPKRRWKLFVAHGFGGSTSLEKPLQDTKVNNYADVFLIGHYHRKFISQEIVYDYSFTDKKYITKEIVLGNTGTFSNSILEGKDSWLEHRNKGLHSRPGTITISFDADNGKLSCHL